MRPDPKRKEPTTPAFVAVNIAKPYIVLVSVVRHQELLGNKLLALARDRIARGIPSSVSSSCDFFGLGYKNDLRIFSAFAHSPRKGNSSIF